MDGSFVAFTLSHTHVHREKTVVTSSGNTSQVQGHTPSFLKLVRVVVMSIQGEPSATLISKSRDTSQVWPTLIWG